MRSTLEELAAGLKQRDSKNTTTTFTGTIVAIDSFAAGRGSTHIDVVISSEVEVAIPMGYDHRCELDLAPLRQVLIGSTAEVIIQQGNLGSSTESNNYAVTLKVTPRQYYNLPGCAQKPQLYYHVGMMNRENLERRWKR